VTDHHHQSIEEFTGSYLLIEADDPRDIIEEPQAGGFGRDEQYQKL
jgi:hypothetical protein